MADIVNQIEVLENRVMRGWMHRNPAELKSVIAPDCLIMFGTNPPALLDRPSLIAGLDRGLNCTGFRFHELTARNYGRCVWFSGHAELELTIGVNKWAGNFLITDLWRKSAFRQRWMLAERSIAPVEGNAKLSDAIRALQLWN